VVEEAAAAHVYSFARRHDLLDSGSAVDFATRRTIPGLTRPFELAIRTPKEWQTAIVEGFGLFRLILKHRGGSIRCDLVNRRVEFAPHA
jgi:hypothetical protein